MKKEIKMHNPPHPGEIIKGLYLESLGLGITQTAIFLNISRKAFSELVNGHSRVSMDMAKRLSKAFGTTIEHWLKLQMQYDLWTSEKKLNKKKYNKIPLLIDESMMTHVS